MKLLIGMTLIVLGGLIAIICYDKLTITASVGIALIIVGIIVSVVKVCDGGPETM